MAQNPPSPLFSRGKSLLGTQSWGSGLKTRHQRLGLRLKDLPKSGYFWCSGDVVVLGCTLFWWRNLRFYALYHLFLNIHDEISTPIRLIFIASSKRWGNATASGSLCVSHTCFARNTSNCINQKKKYPGFLLLLSKGDDSSMHLEIGNATLLCYCVIKGFNHFPPGVDWYCWPLDSL